MCVLDDPIRADDRYEWRGDDGVIVVRPSRARIVRSIEVAIRSGRETDRIFTDKPSACRVIVPTLADGNAPGR